MASRVLHGPELNLIHCTKQLAWYNKFHSLNPIVILFIQYSYWFSWQIWIHKRTQTCMILFIPGNSFLHFIHHCFLLCSILAVRAGRGARWILQLPSLDMPSCLVLTQLFRRFASAAKGAITQVSNTLFDVRSSSQGVKPSRKGKTGWGGWGRGGEGSALQRSFFWNVLKWGK